MPAACKWLVLQSSCCLTPNWQLQQNPVPARSGVAIVVPRASLCSAASQATAGEQVTRANPQQERGSTMRSVVRPFTRKVIANNLACPRLVAAADQSDPDPSAPSILERQLHTMRRTGRLPSLSFFPAGPSSRAGTRASSPCWEGRAAPKQEAAFHSQLDDEEGDGPLQRTLVAGCLAPRRSPQLKERL